MAGALVSVIELGQSTSAAGGPGPTITVLGYGLVNLTHFVNRGAQHLQINLQDSGTVAPVTLAALQHTAPLVTRQLGRKGTVSAKAIAIQSPPYLDTPMELSIRRTRRSK